MAIYHLSIKIISRSKGKSAVAAAAYRAGEKLTETETGYVHDYTRKSGVVHSEIFLPANAPPEYKDREILWNAVQKIENKSNAQLAREIEVALPVELTGEQQLKLLREYVIENFVFAGMCADVAVHDKTVDGRNVLHRNPHAHILLTTRGFKADGTWAAKEKKIYALDEHGKRIPLIDESTGLQKLGKRNEKLWKRETVLANDWNDRSNAEKWRKSWADMCNRYLAPENHIDHRNFARQGVEQIPTIHEGYVARQMERCGRSSERVQLNREIKRLNTVIRKIKGLVAGIGERLIKLKQNLAKARMNDEKRSSREQSSGIGGNAVAYERTAGIDIGDKRGIADGKSGFKKSTGADSQKGQPDNFVEEISAAVKRRERTVDEALERRKEIYERFEKLRQLRSAGNGKTDGTDAGRTDGAGKDYKEAGRRTSAASDLIRMAENTGAFARAGDADSGAIADDSQTGRAYRDAKRERQDSLRQRNLKNRKYDISR